jgi:hypothetical protein
VLGIELSKVDLPGISEQGEGDSVQDELQDGEGLREGLVLWKNQ